MVVHCYNVAIRLMHGTKCHLHTNTALLKLQDSMRKCIFSESEPNYIGIGPYNL